MSGDSINVDETLLEESSSSHDATATDSRARHRKRTRTFRDVIMTSDDAVDEENAAQMKRTNQQMVVYLFFCFVIIASWLLGMYGFSFFWIFLLLGAAFWVWYRKATSLLEQALKEKEVVLMRRRNLRQSETAEWLNFILNRWFVCYIFINTQCYMSYLN